MYCFAFDLATVSLQVRVRNDNELASPHHKMDLENVRGVEKRMNELSVYDNVIATLNFIDVNNCVEGNFTTIG